MLYDLSVYEAVIEAIGVLESADRVGDTTRSRQVVARFLTGLAERVELGMAITDGQPSNIQDLLGQQCSIARDEQADNSASQIAEQIGQFAERIELDKLKSEDFDALRTLVRNVKWDFEDDFGSGGEAIADRRGISSSLRIPPQVGKTITLS